MGLADIALRALLIPGIRPASFLFALQPLHNVSLPDNNIPTIFKWRQPGMSMLVISDEDLIHGWAQELTSNFDILVVHTNDVHFVSWFRRLASNSDAAYSIIKLNTHKWYYRMKAFRGGKQSCRLVNPLTPKDKPACETTTPDELSEDEPNGETTDTGPPYSSD